MTAAGRSKKRPRPASAGSAARRRVPGRAGAGRGAGFSAVVARAGVAHSEAVPEVARQGGVPVARAVGVPVVHSGGAVARHVAHCRGAGVAQAALARDCADVVARAGVAQDREGAAAQAPRQEAGAVCSGAVARLVRAVAAPSDTAVPEVVTGAALVDGSAAGALTAAGSAGVVLSAVMAVGQDVDGSDVPAPGVPAVAGAGRRTAVAARSGCSAGAGRCLRRAAGHVGLAARPVPAAAGAVVPARLPGRRLHGAAGCTSAAGAVVPAAVPGLAPDALQRGQPGALAGSAGSAPVPAARPGSGCAARRVRAFRGSAGRGAAPSRSGRSRRSTPGYAPPDAATGAPRCVPRPVSLRRGSPPGLSGTGPRSGARTGATGAQCGAWAGWAWQRQGLRASPGSTAAGCAGLPGVMLLASSSAGSPRRISVPGRRGDSRSGCGATPSAGASRP